MKLSFEKKLMDDKKSIKFTLNYSDLSPPYNKSNLVFCERDINNSLH